MWPKLKKWTIRISAILFIILFILFFIAELMIGSGVREYSQNAQERFSGDRISALIAMVDCESCAMSGRNHAVWALGQLADIRSLPVLEKHYTGEPCDHKNRICQYELKKALRLVRSGYNSEAFFWKWMLAKEK
jgi:hypothetical protein